MTEAEYYKTRKPFQKIDVMILLVGFFLLIASIFFLVPEKGNRVLVYEDGVLFGEYSLSDYRSVEMRHCTFRIDENGVTMISSDCQNQVCVRTGTINEVHQSIVCAPNKVVIKIEGESDYDAVTGGA